MRSGCREVAAAWCLFTLIQHIFVDQSELKKNSQFMRSACTKCHFLKIYISRLNLCLETPLWPGGRCLVSVPVMFPPVPHFLGVLAHSKGLLRAQLLARVDRQGAVWWLLSSVPSGVCPWGCCPLPRAHHTFEKL